MNDIFSLLLEESLSPDQEAELRERLESNPELAEGWAWWTRARRRIRHRLQEHLPDCRLLVLYALEQEGYDDALTADEKEALDAARDDIANAVEAVPALAQVIERIQDERADFETVWDQHWDDDAERTTAAEQQSPAAERKERAPRRPSRSQESRPLRRWAWRLTAAALLIGAAVLAIFYGPGESSRTKVTMAAGEQRVVTFEDGSTARLSGATTLLYPSGERTDGPRRVTLKRGRAYFDVTPRDSASFIVNTPTATATVLGTQFGVTTEPDTTRVVLVDGAVRVGSAAETREDAVVLAPGERSQVPRGRSPLSPEPVDLTATLDWTGLFVFRSMPVETIAQRLSQHYDVSISVAPALADEPVTGTFEREQPVSEVLTALARTLGANLQTKGDTYRLEPSS
jgi:ferric-dicitrate binding protein FerR (iron transport regulator)